MNIKSIDVKYHNWDTDLFRNGSRLWGLVKVIEVTTPVVVKLDGYVNIRHKGTVGGVVGISSRVGYRYGATPDYFNTLPAGTSPGSWNTPDFKWIPGAKDGKNILDITHHYETLNLDACFKLSEPGAYRIEPYLFEMSALNPNIDGITCVNIDTNQTPNDTFGFLSITVIE